MAKRLGLGIDLGGTKILAGVIDLDTGDVLQTAKKKTRNDPEREELLERLGDAAQDALSAEKLPKGAEVGSVGVAAAGQIDPRRGVVLFAPNLGGLRDLKVRAALRKRLGLPVRLGNDVQGAALGELQFGAGKGVDRLLCVFVGTGIGGALADQGRLESGATSTAGEIGHTVIQADGRHCGCGGRGHLEAYASRTAIARVLLEGLRRGRPSVLRDLLREEGFDPDAPGGTAIRSGLLARAVAEGDDLTLETLRDAARYLGLGLASAINLYNPRRIVLGGGVIEAVPLLLELAAPIVRREALPVAGNAVEIVASKLGDAAGIVGAALLGGANGARRQPGGAP
jgi:glucokinase